MAVNLSVKGRNCVVVGANASGAALAKFLLKKSAQVTLVDGGNFDAAQAYLSERLDLTKMRLEVGEFNPQTFEQATLIVVAQGIPLDLKILEVSRNAGIPVYSELEFFSLFVEEPIIAVAGTNGKSSTAYILKTFLEAGGKSVFSNYDQPLSDYLNQSKAVDYLVLTTNSFQLEGLQYFKPKMVLFLNVSEDHLNRYPNFETYLASNREVFKNLDNESVCILNAQDPNVANIAPHLPSQNYFFSTQALPEGLKGGRLQKNEVTVNVGAEAVKYDLTMCRLRGGHNRENFLAAAIAGQLLGVSAETIRATVEGLRAIPHRLQFAKRINSVAFYDDSCASNPHAVIRSLQAFAEPVILISGGRDKNLDYTPLTTHIRQRVKNLILVGEAKEKMNRMLGDFTETFLVGTMEEAVLLAYQKSRSGDVILLSPGTDSSDAFSSHEERGELFQKLVQQISQPRKPNVI